MKPACAVPSIARTARMMIPDGRSLITGSGFPLFCYRH
jgi:hypothetical protein